MKTYTVYAQEFVPESLLAKYPKPAEYAEGKLYLFAENLEKVTGTPAVDIFDFSVMGLQEDDGTEKSVSIVDGVEVETDMLTKSGLISMVTAMLSGTMTGREIQLSVAQGKYLYSTIFAPKSAIEQQ